MDQSTGCFIEMENRLLPRGTYGLRNFLMLIFRSDLHNNYLEMSRVMRIKERTRWPANPEAFSVLFNFYSWHRCHTPVKGILNKICPTATFLSYLKVTIDSLVKSKAGPSSRWCCQAVATSTEHSASFCKKPYLLSHCTASAETDFRLPWVLQHRPCHIRQKVWKEKDDVRDWGVVLHTAPCCWGPRAPTKELLTYLPLPRWLPVSALLGGKTYLAKSKVANSC